VNEPATAATPRRFNAPQLHGEDTLRVAARHDANLERRRYDAGYHQGHAEGFATGAADVDQAIADHRRNADRLASLCSVLDHAIAERRNADAAALEHAVLELAMRVAETVLEREVHDHDVVVETIRRCLRVERPDDEVTLRVHPEDVACAAEAIDAGLITGADVDLTPDPGIERGGCVVDSPTLRVDGQFGSVLARIRDALSVN